LGSPVLLYLAAAGIGTLGIADGDVVDLSNLQRQIVHTTPDIGSPKVDSAAEKIARLNPHVHIETHPVMAEAENIMDLINNYDFVVDATDNFAAKFMINDACVLAKKPFSHAGVLQFIGQTMTILPNRSACYRCVFGHPPPPDAVPTGAQAGILGAVAGVLGTLQATEVLKFIIHKGELLTNRIVQFDAMNSTFRQVPIQQNPECPACGAEPQISLPRPRDLNQAI
jgi:molybdopterin/thiamine biosynthesis adenylyltransferase